MLSLTVKIQENLDFSLYSKQYLNLTYVMASLSTRLENLKIMASGKVTLIVLSLIPTKRRCQETDQEPVE